MTTTFDRLIKILRKTYKVDAATTTPALRLDELGVDSLGVGLLLFDLEDEFQIKFSRDPGPLHTLADVVLYIDEVMSEQHLADRIDAAPKSSP
jgi:acyl carrier protein